VRLYFEGLSLRRVRSVLHERGRRGASATRLYGRES